MRLLGTQVSTWAARWQKKSWGSDWFVDFIKRNVQEHGAAIEPGTNVCKYEDMEATNKILFWFSASRWTREVQVKILKHLEGGLDVAEYLDDAYWVRFIKTVYAMACYQIHERWVVPFVLRGQEIALAARTAVYASIRSVPTKRFRDRPALDAMPGAAGGLYGRRGAGRA